MLEQLLEAINALTEAILAATAAGQGDQAEEQPAATTKRTRGKKGAANAGGDEEVTMEDVRAVLKGLIDAGHNDVVKALLKKHGGAKLSDVDAGKYAALKAAAEAKTEELAGGDDDLV